VTTTITTASGRTRDLPEHVDAAKVVGLDPDGRIVVEDFGPDPTFVFGLTLCCNAYDKGVENGIVCRNCYSYEENGAYLFRRSDGTYPGLDPVVHP
jgi:hypothetical protein